MKLPELDDDILLYPCVHLILLFALFDDDEDPRLSNDGAKLIIITSPNSL